MQAIVRGVARGLIFTEFVYVLDILLMEEKMDPISWSRHL